MSFFNNPQSRTTNTFFSNNNQPTSRGNDFFTRNAPTNQPTVNTFFGSQNKPNTNINTRPTLPTNQNTNSRYGGPGFFNGRQNPSVYVEGTMHSKYVQVKSIHKECQDSLQNCILFCDEYASNSNSILKKRAEDYRLLKMGNVPNDPEILAGIQKYIQMNHISEKVIDGKLAQEALNTNFSHIQSRTGGGFFRNSGQNIGSIRENNNMNQTNSFFNRNQGGPNQFLSNTAQAQHPQPITPNRPSNSFFSNNNPNTGNTNPTGFINSRTNPTPQANNTFFNNNRNTGSTGSFFNNNPSAPGMQPNQPSATNQQPTGGGFFNRNPVNPNTQQPSQNSFFNRNPPNNTFGNNNNSAMNRPGITPQGGNFFNNPNTNTGNANFPNNIPANANPQSQNFFNRPNSNFNNPQNMQQQQQPQQNPGSFFNNVPQQNQPTNANPYMGPMPMYGIMPQPYMMPYCPYGYIPVIPNQSPVKQQQSQNDEVEKQLQLEKDLEKKYEVMANNDFSKRLLEIERQAALAQRFYDSARKEDSDKKLLRPLKGHKQPEIINTSKSKIKSIFNASKDKTSNTSLSFTSGPIKYSDDDKILNATIEKGNKIVSLNVNVDFIDEHFVVEDLKINKSRTVDEFKSFVIKRIPKSGYTSEHLFKKGIMIFNDTLTNGSKKLRDVKDIETANVILRFDLCINDKLSKHSKKTIEEVDDDDFTPEIKEKLCNEKILPQFSKMGYEIYPPMTKLARMSEDELRNVENFTVSNDYGKIEWVGPTDLTEVNIDLWVIIKRDGVEVYPEDMFNEKNKHARGTKLNKSAIITLYNTYPKSTRLGINFEKQLQLICEKQDAQHISYDELSGTWVFKVFHFTKYCFIDVDEEEDEEKEHKTQQKNFDEQKTLLKEIGDSNKGDKARQITKLADQAFEDSIVVEEEQKINTKQPNQKERDLKDLNNVAGENVPQNNKNFNEFGRSKFIKVSYPEEEQEASFNDENIKEIRKAMKNITMDYDNYLQISKQKLKQYKKPDYNSLEQETLTNVMKVNGLLAGIPFIDPKKHIVDDFSFAIDFKDLAYPYMIDKVNGTNFIQAKLNFEKLIMPKLHVKALEKAFEYSDKPVSPSNIKQLEFFYQFIFAYYNDLSKNAINSDDRNYLKLLELMLACFGLYNIDIKMTDKFDITILNRAINEFNKNKENPHIENVRRRRSVFKWLDQYINKTDLHLNNSITSEKADLDVSTILLKKLNLEGLNQASLLSGISPIAENESLLEIFCNTMKNSQSETLEETFEKFTYKSKQVEEDDIENFFLNSLLILLKIQKFKSNISSMDYFEIFDNQNDKPAEMQILYLLTLNLLKLTNPDLEENKLFNEKLKWALNRCYESLLHTKNFFSAIMIYQMGQLDHDQTEKLIENALNLYFQDREASKFNNKQNEIILNHYDKSKFRTLKLLKYYIEEDYSTAMKALCELGNIEQAYELLIKNICKQFIAEGQLSTEVIAALLERFKLIERYGRIEDKKIGFIIYNYIKFEQLAQSKVPDEKLALSLLDDIFNNFRRLSEKINATEFSENKELLRVITVNVLNILTGIEDNRLKEVLNTFIDKVVKKEYYLLLDAKSTENVLKRFVNKRYK